jgi:hypothetical protein
MSQPAWPRRRDFKKKVLPELLQVLGRQIEVLERSAEVFQDGQNLVPLPTVEELAAMRRRERPLALEAYLIGLYQRAIIAAEDLASDLRLAIEEDILKGVKNLQLTEAEFNGIAAGLERLRGRADLLKRKGGAQ